MIAKPQRQILEALLEALPEYRQKDADKMKCYYNIGYNHSLEDVRAIINEFLNREVENE